VLLLDAGGLFPQGGFGPVVSEMIYKIGIESMRAAGYDAMNLAASDLQNGVQVVTGANAQVRLPLVTTNIVHKNTRIPLESPYRVLDVNGITVGLLSISAQDALVKLPSSGLFDLLEVIPPAEALNHYLPMVRKNAQVVILLSSAGLDETKTILREVKGIDLALVSGNSHTESHSCAELQELQANGQELPANLNVLAVTEKGQALGHVTLEIHPTQPARTIGVEYIPMDSSVPLDPNIVQMTGKDVYKDAVMALRAQVEESRKQMEQEIQKSLQLTPEEYFMKMQQDQNKSGAKQ
jgi:2',3'-cyclic-nucleotide 2'-phosphodiesterase (5'-nucleotidase family)